MLSKLEVNNEFKEKVFIQTVIYKKTKNGKEYITGALCDKTMVLKYFMWDLENTSRGLPKEETYYEINGRLEVFNDKKQVNLFNLVELNESEINLEDFKKTTTFNINDLWDDLCVLVNSIKDPFIKDIANDLLNDPDIKEKFKTAPAAINVHNAWVGGLLEHSLVMAKLSESMVDYYNKNYFKGKLNKDIIIFGCLFHDLGKIWEFDSSTPEIKGSLLGEFLGHIYLGARKIENSAVKYIDKYGQEKRLELNKIVHIVLSHHGKLEWGAPVLPKTPEAIFVHYLDNLDTKIMNAWDNLKDCEKNFTSKNFVQENARLFNTLKE